MYKATTYFTSLFSKLRIVDTDIRQTIINIFGGLVESILRDAPESCRIPALQLVTRTIRSNSKYLIDMKEAGKPLDPRMLKNFQLFADMTRALIQKIGLRTARSAAADGILNQVFLSDIACDIGECIGDFKETTSIRLRVEILKRLKVLLVDYNTVQNTDLTIREIFNQNTSYGTEL